MNRDHCRGIRDRQGTLPDMPLTSLYLPPDGKTPEHAINCGVLNNRGACLIKIQTGRRSLR